MKVHKSLMEARDSFHKLSLKKTGLNKFAGYSYFELADFVIPAMRVFREHGLCPVISFGKEVATMTITHTEDASTVEITSPMAEAQLKGCHPIQNLGAVETYTRRYLWAAALELVEHDAIDSNSGDKVQDVAAILRGISGSSTLDILKSNYEMAMQMLDSQHHKAINQTASARKKELTQQKETA